MSRTRIISVLFGIALIAAMIASEFLSSSPNGIGPYQFFVIILGLCIVGIGLSPTSHWIGRLLIVLSSVVITLMLIEGGLMVLSRLDSTVTYPEVRELVDDEILGKRTPPNARGHDSRGWRNQSALQRADIVAIGDSQTWGVNARLEETYPSVLAGLTDTTVYSMAQGSYGAVQYRVLLEQALELSPQLVIVGLYFGNDFADAYTIVYGDFAHKDLRDPEFDFSSISQTIAEQAVALQPAGLTNLNQIVPLRVNDMTLWDRMQSGTFIGKLLTQFGILNAVGQDTFVEQMTRNQDIVKQFPDLFSSYSHNGVITFLTPAYRHLVLNSETPIIAEGIRITKQQFEVMQAMMSDDQVELLVVLIPTKELVYLPYVDDVMISAPYMMLAEQEQQIRDSLIEFFEENDISFVDTLPVLRTAVESDVPIYPSTFDGHPNASGYEIIANTIADYIDSHDIIE